MQRGDPVEKAEHERRDDADDRHGGRRGTHPHQRPELRRDADLEQQHDDAHLGEELDDGRERIGRRRGDHAQHAAPQQDADHQLAQHWGLPHALAELAGELPGQEHDAEHGKEADDERHYSGCVAVEGEGVVEEGEVDRFAVRGLDEDLAGRGTPPHHHPRCRVRQSDVLHGGRDAPLNRAIVERGGETRLRIHLVEQAVVTEEHLADVDTVVQERHEDQKREETARRARPPRAPRPSLGHHCD